MWDVFGCVLSLYACVCVYRIFDYDPDSDSDFNLSGRLYRKDSTREESGKSGKYKDENCQRKGHINSANDEKNLCPLILLLFPQNQEKKRQVVSSPASSHLSVPAVSR